MLVNRRYRDMTPTEMHAEAARLRALDVRALNLEAASGVLERHARDLESAAIGVRAESGMCAPVTAVCLANRAALLEETADQLESAARLTSDLFPGEPDPGDVQGSNG